MGIEKPARDETITSAWGKSVADTLNRLGVGMLRAYSEDVLVDSTSSIIIPFAGVEVDSRVFFHPENGSVIISEGRAGVFVVTAYLHVKGLPDDQWGRAYLYRNGVSFAGGSIVGAGGTSVPLSIAGIESFEEGDSLQVRVSFQNIATVTIENVSMTRIAENT